MLRRRPFLIVLATSLALFPAGEAWGRTTDAAVKRGLARLVAAKGGPPGAIATLHRRGRTTVLSVGRADVRIRRAPRARDHMRIASVSKAFSGAIALRLVQDGRLELDDTIGEHRPDLPAAWANVTVRQLLRHTSGVPDYTRSAAFGRHFQTGARDYVAPLEIIGWVRDEGLDFHPGSKFQYSNTDNIVVGLIAERVTGFSYGQLLWRLVFRPGALRSTSFPGGLAIPKPFIHGYAAGPDGSPVDASTLLNPTGAWASGGIVSTPFDLGRFVRRDLNRTFFGREQQRQQLDFVPGESSPPGPGQNAAGLAIFRYRSRCGTVYGHTGSFPGYTQFMAASADGRRSVTTTLNLAPIADGPLLTRLRAVQATAVCAMLGR